MKTIFKSIHGSKLYGTSHAGSDTDYKVVYSKSLSELITDAPDCYREQTPDDTEFFSIKKFALLLGQQQTNAIEMLFTPEQFIIETSPAWDELRANKHRLVSKNIMPFVGYAKQQARVYSEKGHSLNMLQALDADIKHWSTYHSVVDTTKALEYTDGKYASVELPKLCEKYPTLISRGEKHSDNNDEPICYYQVLDRQFECLITFNEFAWGVASMISKYGERAKAAAKDGAFDRKAMYHAVRIIGEANELLDTGGLIFPRPEPDLRELKTIRFDESCTFQKAQDVLMLNYNLLMEVSMPNSTLQENLDKDYLDSWFRVTQTTVVKKGLLLG